MSLTKKNEILAKFDGWKKPARHFYHPERNLTTYELKYHQSYDWLFDVWIKFRDLKFDVVKHKFTHSKFRLNIGNSMLYDNISEAHKELYNAIVWYDSIKKEGNV